MKEKKTVFKLFFVWDFEKEERWLNEMAQEGWVLDNTGFSFYTFVRCEPGEYIIRLEMNPSSDYHAFVKELGAEYIGDRRQATELPDIQRIAIHGLLPANMPHIT